VRPRALERLRHRLEEGGVDQGLDLLSSQIAGQVAARRAQLGLSQAELAALCATTQSAIARVEAGARPPRIDTLERIANALDCRLRVELEPRTRTRGGAR
jgi:transcriptional regulator with XRE-family HTH domain